MLGETRFMIPRVWDALWGCDGNSVERGLTKRFLADTAGGPVSADISDFPKQLGEELKTLELNVPRGSCGAQSTTGSAYQARTSAIGASRVRSGTAATWIGPLTTSSFPRHCGLISSDIRYALWLRVRAFPRERSTTRTSSICCCNGRRRSKKAANADRPAVTSRSATKTFAGSTSDFKPTIFDH